MLFSDKSRDVSLHDDLSVSREVHISHLPAPLHQTPLPPLLSLPGTPIHHLLRHLHPPDILRGGDQMFGAEHRTEGNRDGHQYISGYITFSPLKFSFTYPDELELDCLCGFI